MSDIKKIKRQLKAIYKLYDKVVKLSKKRLILLENSQSEANSDIYDKLKNQIDKLINYKRQYISLLKDDKASNNEKNKLINYINKVIDSQKDMFHPTHIKKELDALNEIRKCSKINKKLLDKIIPKLEDIINEIAQALRHDNGSREFRIIKDSVETSKELLIILKELKQSNDVHYDFKGHYDIKLINEYHVILDEKKKIANEKTVDIANNLIAYLKIEQRAVDQIIKSENMKKIIKNIISKDLSSIDALIEKTPFKDFKKYLSTVETAITIALAGAAVSPVFSQHSENRYDNSVAKIYAEYDIRRADFNEDYKQKMVRYLSTKKYDFFNKKGLSEMMAIIATKINHNNSNIDTKYDVFDALKSVDNISKGLTNDEKGEYHLTMVSYHKDVINKGKFDDQTVADNLIKAVELLPMEKVLENGDAYKEIKDMDSFEDILGATNLTPDEKDTKRFNYSKMQYEKFGDKNTLKELVKTHSAGRNSSVETKNAYEALIDIYTIEPEYSKNRTEFKDICIRFFTYFSNTNQKAKLKKAQLNGANNLNNQMTMVN